MKISVLYIFLLFLSCKSGAVLIGNVQPYTLKSGLMVYESDDEASTIVDILPKGKTVPAISSKNNWIQIQSDEHKGFWLQEKQEVRVSEKTNNTKGKAYDFTIPKTGASSFSIVKIDERYSYTLNNANTVEALQRLFLLEKKSMSLPSELAPVTMSGSSVTFSDLLDKFRKTGFFLSEPHEIHPYLWAKDLTSDLRKSALRQDLPSISYRAYSSAETKPETLLPGAENENSLSYLASTDTYILSAENNEFSKYDKMRKKLKTVPFSEILKNAGEFNDCSQMIGLVFNEPSGAVLFQVQDQGCGSPGTYVLFLDDNFNFLKKIFYNGKKANFPQISLSGDRFLLRMQDITNDAAPEKTDIIFQVKGGNISEKTFPEMEPVIYDAELKREIRFNHSTIFIRPLQGGNTIKETLPMEFKNSFLLEGGEDTLVYGKNNTFYVLNISTGKIHGQFRLSASHNLVDLSGGRYALISSGDKDGVWSAVDLLQRKVLYSNYKNSVFRKVPVKIRKIPYDEKFILFNPGESTRSIVYGDSRGSLFKTSLFDESTAVYDIQFKKGLLYVHSEKGRYFLSVANLLKEGRKIE